MLNVRSFLLGFFSLGFVLLLVAAIPGSLTDLQTQSYRDCGNTPCQQAILLPPMAVTVIEAQLSCTSTSSTLVAANVKRLEIEYVNLSTDLAYICGGGTDPATTTDCRPYQQYTGRIDDKYSGIVTCISAGTSTIYVRQVSRP